MFRPEFQREFSVQNSQVSGYLIKQNNEIKEIRNMSLKLHEFVTVRGKNVNPSESLRVQV